MMNGCPSGAQLAQLLENQLGEAEHGRLVEHVEACARCQDALETLTSSPSSGRPESWLRPDLTAPERGGPAAAVACWPAIPGLDVSATWPDSSSGEREGWPEVPGFDLLEELGRGGMGVVYKARQRALSRPVALKMIRAGGQARPRELARFRIEAEAVARLRHPNILQIYAIGEVGGLPYVALELLEGGSLEARLSGKPQPGPESAGLIATLSRAVHAAHQAGIVHRDLKPSNILFTRDGIPKIADFGLAKRLGQEDGQTESGQVLGSPGYLSPEQARGRNREVGPLADVYSLGAILYQMLAGRSPFRGSTPVETVLQVIHDDPVPPSQLQPRVPRDLETICLTCLAKDPRRRYPDADALADDLGRFLAGEPIRARATPRWERAWKWARRRPTAALLIALGLGSALALAGTGRHLLRERAERARLVAGLRVKGEDAVSRARDALGRGDWPGAQAILSGLLPKLEGESRLADLADRAAGLLEQAARRRAGQVARDSALARYARFLRLRDDAFVRDVHFTGLDLPTDPAAVRESARSALAVFGGPDGGDLRLPGHLPTELEPGERARVIAGSYELLLILAEAVAQPTPSEDPTRQADEALGILDRAARLAPRSTRAYYATRAACLARKGDRDGEARERDRAERLPPADAADHFLFGLERYKRGQLAEAQRHFDAAVKRDPDHSRALAMSAVCDLHERPPRPEVASAKLRDCVVRHPDSAWLHQLRGIANGQCRSESARQDAEADFRKALESGPGGDLRYAVLVNRGLFRTRQGRLDEAVADLEEAIRLDPGRYQAHVNLAHIDWQRGRRAEAIARIGRAIALGPDLAAPYRTRALWELERGSRAEALRDIERALGHEPGEGPWAAMDLALRGQVLYLEERFSEALDACETALKIDPKGADALRWKVFSLLELRRYDDVLEACDASMVKGPNAAEFLELRGLAKARRDDHAGAIDEFTQALALRPDRASLYAQRGWAHLVSEAPKLALRDFEAAVGLDPDDGDAYSGRGSSLAILGEARRALADADESLRHGEPTSRRLYNAARIYAQAAAVVAEREGRRGGDTLDRAVRYQDRAVDLLEKALGRLPGSRRPAFWRDVVRGDAALRAVRRRPRFAELDARYATTIPSGG